MSNSQSEFCEKFPLFLERVINAFSLTDRHHMADLVSFIHFQEIATIKQELSGCPVSVVFDGTTRLGEALAIVVCFVDDKLCIQQYLIRMQFLTKSMPGEEIGRQLKGLVQEGVNPHFIKILLLAPCVSL